MSPKGSMIERISRFLLVLIALSASSMAVQAGQGGCPEKPEDKKTAKSLAGEWFARGEKMVEQRRDQEALQSFTCSLKMVEHPATLFNAGQAARLVGKHTQALKLLRRYLELSPRGLTSDKARQFISELEQAEQASSQKGEPRQPSGTHDGLALHGSDDGQGKKDKALLIGGYVSLGLGSAGIITGTVLQILAGKIALGDATETDDYSEYQRLDEKRRAYQIGAVVGFAVGGAVLGAGLALMMMAKKGERENPTEPKISIVPGFGMVTVVGRF